jgi:hypothetical protein
MDTLTNHMIKETPEGHRLMPLLIKKKKRKKKE